MREKSKSRGWDRRCCQTLSEVKHAGLDVDRSGASIDDVGVMVRN